MINTKVLLNNKFEFVKFETRENFEFLACEVHCGS